MHIWPNTWEYMPQFVVSSTIEALQVHRESFAQLPYNGLRTHTPVVLTIRGINVLGTKPYLRTNPFTDIVTITYTTCDPVSK